MTPRWALTVTTTGGVAAAGWADTPVALAVVKVAVPTSTRLARRAGSFDGAMVLSPDRAHPAAGGSGAG